MHAKNEGDELRTVRNELNQKIFLNKKRNMFSKLCNKIERNNSMRYLYGTLRPLVAVFFIVDALTITFTEKC